MARELPSGILIYPKRGKQIVCPEGYELVSGETHQCRPILIDCEHRDVRDHKQPCGRVIHILYCKKELMVVNRGICKYCRERSTNV